MIQLISYLGFADKVLGDSRHDFTPAQTLAMAQESQKVTFIVSATE
jgi:hypothetical protein